MSKTNVVELTKVVSPDPAIGLSRAWLEIERESTSWPDQTDHEVTLVVELEACLEDKLALTPTDTLEGLAAKLAVLREMVRYEEADGIINLLRSVADDAERLVRN